MLSARSCSCRPPVRRRMPEVGVGPTTYGLEFYFGPRSPGLPPWAKLFRP